jgi:hypothetical protein
MSLLDMFRTPLVVALLGASLAIACSKQAEGERCDPNSQSLDCDTGLICRPGEQLNIVGAGIGLCCPPDGVPSTVSACQAGAELPEDMPMAPLPQVDAGAADAGG